MPRHFRQAASQPPCADSSMRNRSCPAPDIFNAFGAFQACYEVHAHAATAVISPGTREYPQVARACGRLASLDTRTPSSCAATLATAGTQTTSHLPAPLPPSDHNACRRSSEPAATRYLARHTDGALTFVDDIARGVFFWCVLSPHHPAPSIFSTLRALSNIDLRSPHRRDSLTFLTPSSPPSTLPMSAIVAGSSLSTQLRAARLRPPSHPPPKSLARTLLATL